MKNLCCITCRKLHKITCSFFTGADSEKPKEGTGLSRSSNGLNKKIKLVDLNVEENNNGIVNVNTKVPSDANPKLNDFLLDL